MSIIRELPVAPYEIFLINHRLPSIIPHDFGRQRPKVIDNNQALQEELNLVDALGDMVRILTIVLRREST